MMKIVDREATGKHIGKIMDEKGFKDELIANVLGIRPKTVASWKKGESLPGTGRLYTLSGILGVSMDELVIRYPDPPVG